MSKSELTKPQSKPVIANYKRPTKRQRLFIELWLSPESDTFGNAYQSAIKAGFSKNAARVITGEAKGLQWVQEAKNLYAAAFTPEHIYKGVQDIATKTRADRDKLTAYAMLGKWNGMDITRVESNVNVKFTNSVPRPVIDLTDAPAANPLSTQ